MVWWYRLQWPLVRLPQWFPGTISNLMLWPIFLDKSLDWLFMNEKFSNPLVLADFLECHCTSLEVTWFLGACLPLHEVGIHPWEALPGLDNLLLFSLHALATDLRAARCFCFNSLVLHALVRKMPGGLFLWNLSWACCTLSCGQSSPRPFFCILGVSASPLLGGLLVSPKASGPLWSVNTMQGDALGMPGSVGAASPFHLGVVGGRAPPV